MDGDVRGRREAQLLARFNIWQKEPICHAAFQPWHARAAGSRYSAEKVVQRLRELHLVTDGHFVESHNPVPTFLYQHYFLRLPQPVR